MTVSYVLQAFLSFYDLESPIFQKTIGNVFRLFLESKYGISERKGHKTSQLKVGGSVQKSYALYKSVSLGEKNLRISAIFFIGYD